MERKKEWIKIGEWREKEDKENKRMERNRGVWREIR